MRMKESRPSIRNRCTLERALLNEAPLLLDGALGTELLQHLNSELTCLESLNVARPEIVSQLHRDYIEAGARVLCTNSFGANARSLGNHGLGHEAQHLAHQAGRLAVAAARGAEPTCYVLGSLGPGAGLPSRGELTSSELCACLRPAIEGLLEAEVDALLFETLRDPMQALAAAEAVRQVAGTAKPPFAFSFHPESDGSIVSGHKPVELWQQIENCAPLFLAFNCGNGPQPVDRALAQMSHLQAGPMLGAWANTGTPQAPPSTAMDGEAFAAWCLTSSQRFNLAIVGGCCGSGPAHVRAAARKLSRR